MEDSMWKDVFVMISCS